MKMITLYAHIDKESAIDAGRKAGLEGKALETFKFAGYEHKLEYLVNEETGEAIISKIDGRGVLPS